jgi:hypothetical protein
MARVLVCAFYLLTSVKMMCPSAYHQRHPYQQMAAHGASIDSYLGAGPTGWTTRRGEQVLNIPDDVLWACGGPKRKLVYYVTDFTRNRWMRAA